MGDCDIACIPSKVTVITLLHCCDFPAVQWMTARTSCLPTDLEGRTVAAVHKKHLYVDIHSKSEGHLVFRVAGQNFKNVEKLNAPPDTLACFGLISHNHCLYYLSHPSKANDPDEHSVLFQLDEATEACTTERHSQKSLTWRRLQKGRCPVKQLFPACFGVGDSLVLAGGKTLDKSLTLVTEYDLVSEEWCAPSTWPSLPEAAHQQNAVILGDDFHLFGGLNKSGTDVRRTISTHSIKIERNGHPWGDWREGDLPSPPNQVSGACRLFQTVIVAGGRREDHVHPGVHVLDPYTHEWLPLPPLETARTQPSVVFFQGSSWLSTIERLALG